MSQVCTIMITDRDTPQPKVQQLANEKTLATCNRTGVSQVSCQYKLSVFSCQYISCQYKLSVSAAAAVECIVRTLHFAGEVYLATLQTDTLSWSLVVYSFQHHSSVKKFTGFFL